MTPVHNNIILHPDDDGKTHLNVYTRAKTPLGRAASNLAERPIIHPVHGPFRTLEGLWCFLRTGCFEDNFRVISGFEAKRLSKTTEKQWNTQFKQMFKLGILAKVQGHDDIRQMLKDSDLPIVHYYFYGTPEKGGTKVVVPKGHEWQMNYWEEIRCALKEGRPLDDLQAALLDIPLLS